MVSHCTNIPILTVPSVEFGGSRLFGGVPWSSRGPEGPIAGVATKAIDALVCGGNLKMTLNSQALKSCHLQHGTLKVTPAGPRLTDRDASRLASTVGTIMRNRGKSVKRLELDLSEVYTMSITALGMCLEFERMAKSARSDLVLNDVSEPIREVLRLLRLDRLLGGTPRPRAWSPRRRRVA